MLSKVLVFIVLFFAVVGLTMYWDHWKTIRSCEAAPGLPYNELKSMFTRSGNDRWWACQIEKQGSPGVWKVYLPDPSTIGEYACTIEHNGTIVLTSHYGR